MTKYDIICCVQNYGNKEWNSIATYHIIINKKVEKCFSEKEITCATGQGQPRPFSFKIQKNAIEIVYEMSKTKSLE